MSVTDLPDITYPHVYHTRKLLTWRQQQTHMIGSIFKTQGFQRHNFLIDINSVFSSAPAGVPVDRTKSVVMPLRFEINRAWQPPKQSVSLSQALQSRVQALLSNNCKINLFWSGGIDSTAMLTAFLLHTETRSQLRVFYSPFSTYEHPQYLDFLRQFQDLELIDISGMVYMTTVFDGLFVTGDGGDELMASIDQSFFAEQGRRALDLPWQDLFASKNNNDEFMQFCVDYFALASRPIETVLEARWFFYAMCKTRYQLLRKLDLFAHYPDFVPDRLLGFFDCQEIESWIYWNMEQIVPGSEYSDWKLPFKKYCFDFDHFADWYANKQKFNSGQPLWYANKNRAMHDQRYIFILTDGRRIATPNLPLLSQTEYQQCFGHQLDYLFNEPDQI